MTVKEWLVAGCLVATWAVGGYIVGKNFWEMPGRPRRKRKPPKRMLIPPEVKCPLRFICGHPCTFYLNPFFWAICAVFLAQAMYQIYSVGISAVSGLFTALGAGMILWALFDGFKPETK
jgi:hypothetical protein